MFTWGKLYFDRVMDICCLTPDRFVAETRVFRANYFVAQKKSILVGLTGMLMQFIYAIVVYLYTFVCCLIMA